MLREHTAQHERNIEQTHAQLQTALDQERQQHDAEVPLYLSAVGASLGPWGSCGTSDTVGRGGAVQGGGQRGCSRGQSAAWERRSVCSGPPRAACCSGRKCPVE